MIHSSFKIKFLTILSNSSFSLITQPGIKLYNINHRFKRRCFIQDADSVSSAKLKERRHNAGQDVEMLKYCEALASFDKKNYTAACMSSATIAIQAQSHQIATNPLLPGVSAYHALSGWQESYCKDDVKNLTYTQAYQSIQTDAHRNAVMVAYLKQLLRQNNANEIRKPTVEEINDLSSTSVFESTRYHVNVKINSTQSINEASTSSKILKPVHLCSCDELQSMQQVERQILILASEKEHIDSFYDRLIRSGFSAEMIGVYVGGENKRLTSEEKLELLARRILIGTYPMAGEGLDVPTLNVVAFLTPRSSITDQAIGRALRDKLSPEIMPVVLDFVDDWCRMAYNMHQNRNRSYQFYNAIRKNFDDFNSFEAIGAVCWKKPLRNRTQRLADQRLAAREQSKLERSALKLAKKRKGEQVQNITKQKQMEEEEEEEEDSSITEETEEVSDEVSDFEEEM